ncbi:MAG: hypothetical protein ABSH44_00635 [Bryobacteraceae bacterium]
MRTCTLLILAAMSARAQFVAVSAADYQTTVAPASLVSLFGVNLASQTAQAQLDSSGQLPTELGGVGVQVAGHAAQLLYVSPVQVNLVMPAAIASGIASITIQPTGPGAALTSTVQVSNTAPAVFSMDASGSGAGAILNAVTYAGGPFLVETAQNLGDDKRTRLAIFGTGIRYAGNPFLDASVTNATGAVTAQALDSAGNVYSLPVEYAGAAAVYFGLDQVNVVLPPQLDGLGVLSLTLTAGTVSSNVVTFTVGSLPASALRLVGLALASSSVVSGGSVTGTVTMNAPARDAGFRVSVSSSAGFVQAPGAVTIATGQVSTDFTLQATATGAGVATITASANGVSTTALLTVNSAASPRVAALSLNASAVAGGTSVTGTVTLSAAAPSGGVVIQLSSGSTLAQTPSTVTIPWARTSATFTVTTSSTATAQAVTITASYNGSSQSATLTVNPVFTFVLSSTSVTSGQPVTGTVTFGSPVPAGGAKVNFTSSDVLTVTVPSLILVSGGQSTLNVAISTGPVPAARTVTITATYQGIALQASLTVLPAGTPMMSSVTLSASTVKGGAAVTGTAVLTVAAPLTGSVTVTLASSNKLVAQVPSSVMVAAGQTSAKFTVTTTAVTSVQTVTISGTAGGVTKSATLTVQ